MLTCIPGKGVSRLLLNRDWCSLLTGCCICTGCCIWNRLKFSRLKPPSAWEDWPLSDAGKSVLNTPGQHSHAGEHYQDFACLQSTHAGAALLC